jgi:hypothetical protein
MRMTVGKPLLCIDEAKQRLALQHDFLPNETTDAWAVASHAIIGKLNTILCPPPGRIGNPSVDVGFPPASTVGADPELGGEGPLGNLAIDGGTGQAGAGKDGFQANDTLWCLHGGAASCWMRLRAPAQDKTRTR